MSVTRTCIITVLIAFAMFACVSWMSARQAGDVDPFSDANGNSTAQITIPLSVFMSIRTQDMTTQIFTCPSGTAERDLMLDPNGNLP
jgi:hypothetical protein